MKRILLILALSAITFCGYAQKKDWAQFGRYEKSNTEVLARDVRPDVVFMGNSITDGWARQDPKFFEENNFVGRGISGQVTAQMLARFRSDVLNHKPKYVVILAGTNDIAMNQGFVSLDHIFENIVSMAELAKANKIIPVICSVLPADHYFWRPSVKPAEDIVKLNEALKEYADSKKIQYIDYYSVLADENGGLPKQHAEDGVHPNLSCYKIMEKIVLETL